MITIGQLVERDMSIRWRCEVCRAYGYVDLVALQKAKGADFTLANRRPPCRHCPGRVKFEDATSVFPRPIDTIKQGADAYWAFYDAQRARLYGLGWRVRDGKWVRPG